MERNTMAYKSKQFLMFAGPALILFCMVIIIPFIYGLFLTFLVPTGLFVRFQLSVVIQAALFGLVVSAVRAEARDNRPPEARFA